MTAESWLHLATVLALIGIPALLWFAVQDLRRPLDLRHDEERAGWLEVLIELRNREECRRKWARFRIGR